MNERLRVIIFFLLIFGWLFFLGRAGLPLAHEWLDPVAMRDTGTMFSYLASRPDALRSLALATLQHVEGPLQYIIFNMYCLAVGDMFPLNPATMQFPNTIFAFLNFVYLLFLYARNLFSVRMAFLLRSGFCALPMVGGHNSGALVIEHSILFAAFQHILFFCMFYEGTGFLILQDRCADIFDAIYADSLGLADIHILFIGFLFSERKLQGRLAESL